jgi:tRNA pseudouridine13 synthase
MKLKQLPSDFLVEEISSIQVSQERKPHSIFIMEKSELDTFDAIRLLSEKTTIPLFEIGYAGLKDKHAVTRQYISLPTRYSIQFQNTDRLSLFFVGYYIRKIKIGDLKGNKFDIVVRDIRRDKIDRIYEKMKHVSLYGVPNYFDSQRFGSVFNSEFIGKYLIKKNYEDAVKIFLTRYLKSESKHVKDEKRNILKNWPNLEKVSIQNKVFARVIKEYLNNNNWLEAYKKIPANLREMHVNAYQSYLWNECVKEILRICVNGRKIYSVKYAVDSLYFYKDLSDEERSNIPSVFPTLSDTVELSAFDTKIVTKVLSNEKSTLQDFDIKLSTGNFFKTRKRPVLILPENVHISNPMDDELNTINGRPQKKITLSFILPRGSYATVVTKRIFSQ